jgi:colanic acid biosynthesis glycosyl transferase WcaI
MQLLVSGLRARGMTVDVLTTFPHYQSFRIEAPYRGRLAARSTETGGTVTRLWVFASGQKRKMLHRLTNYLSFNALATLAGWLQHRSYDVILANSGSFFTGVSSWLLGRLRATPFIYNVQDIYPDVPVRAGQLRSPLAIRALERIERFMYARAAHVTVISTEQRMVLESRGVPATRLSVIPNFVDTDFIRPLPRDNPVARRLQLQDRFVIGHAGNLGLAYDFESLLQVARRCRQNSDMLFLIVGDGVRRGELADIVARDELHNVCMLPYLPEAELPFLRAAMDVQLSLYRKAAAQSSLPSKLYEIMASGRPAVVSAERGSDLYQLVTASGCGLVVEPEHADQLYSALLKLHGDQAYRELLGSRGREAALRSYSVTAAVDAYAQLIDKVRNDTQ